MDGTSTMLSQCPRCQKVLNIGDWPFECKIFGEHALRSENSQSFPPLVYDRDPLTGKISYPTSSKDEIPAGYVRESLTTLAQVDRFCRARSDEESAKRRDHIRAEKAFWDARIQARREWVREEMKKRGFKGKGFEAVIRFLDARRERKYDELLRREVHFFSDVGSFDSSNREPHSSPETGWRNRKA